MFLVDLCVNTDACFGFQRILTSIDEKQRISYVDFQEVHIPNYFGIKILTIAHQNSNKYLNKYQIYLYETGLEKSVTHC